MSCAFFGFEAVWSIFPLIFMVFFIAVVVMIIKKVAADRAERRLPVESRWARIAAKRTHVAGSNSAYTSYFVTLEFDDGARAEYRTDPEVYAMIAEGDMGTAGIQGTRLASFEREAAVKEEPFSSWHRCSSCGATFRGERCDYCGTPWTEEK